MIRATGMRMVIGAVAFAALSGTVTGLEIVSQGRPAATVVCADDASNQLTAAVRLLRDCVETASGAQLPVAADAPETGNVIYVGPGSWVETFAMDQDGLDDDGFEIRFPDPRSMVILGPTDWGTEFGIYDFLERCVGVRWLMPGPVGTHIPTRETIRSPEQTIRQEPAFFSRRFSGMNKSDPTRATWNRRNRFHQRLEFHHNMARKLFPWETYKKTHPDFFPLIDGKRFLPKAIQRHKWQPCFSNPATVIEAVKNITAYFDEHPNATSYSLGVNDTHADHWCTCENCVAEYSGKLNSLGQPDYSDIYYDWCNRVIEGVLRTHPGKWFGCLVYNNTYDPPTKTRVHPRLIPFICLDRMQWVDENRRESGPGR